MLRMSGISVPICYFYSNIILIIFSKLQYYSERVYTQCYW